MKTVQSMTGTLCAGVILTVSVSAHAEDAAKPASPFTASLDLQEYYTDNVFFSRPLYDQTRRGDWVTVIRPAIGYGYVFEKGRIDLGATAEIGRYATYSSEDYVDFNAHADGSYRFDPSTFAIWGVSVGREHEARSSIEPSDQIGTNPTQYWKTSAYGAISRRFGDNTVKLGMTYAGYDFSDASTTIPPYTINNDDRDRDMMTVGGRFTHRLDARQRIFAETTFDLRRYRSSIDDAGYARDSQGVRAIAGWQADVGEHGRAEVYGGLLYQDYRDSRFANVAAPDFGGRYSWQANGASIVAGLRRTLEETTLAGVSSYVNTTASLRMSQDLPNAIRLYGGLSLSDLDFQNSDRRDQMTNFWLGARKYVTPHLYLGAEAGFEERESSSAADDYTETRIMARVGIDSQRAFDPDATSALSETLSGFYLGAGGEISHPGTMLDGQRQGTVGNLTADFGALGAAGRVIGGWGTYLDGTYLGAEGDFSVSDARWDHSRQPGGGSYSVEERNSLGVSFLGGRRIGGGTLVYGRAGIRSTAFDTDYAGAATYSNRLTGFEYGFGVRTPLTANTALSLEYAQARYPDYGASTGHGAPDRFANVEDSVRLALTYHFGGIPGAAQPLQPPSYGGAHWGLQAGLGVLDSLAQGNRPPEGGSTVPSVLTADRGDHGFTGGALLGYDYQSGRFVVGGEVDAELARETWNQERAPNGRSVSLRKDGSVGISGRVGYVLYGGALLYGRAGAVTTRFHTDFSTTGTTLASDDWRTALRYGGGLEVPLSASSRLRFDYTFTDYGTLSLGTPSGTETYDTKESLFRVGYLKAF